MLIKVSEAQKEVLDSLYEADYTVYVHETKEFFSPASTTPVADIEHYELVLDLIDLPGCFIVVFAERTFLSKYWGLLLGFSLFLHYAIWRICS